MKGLGPGLLQHCVSSLLPALTVTYLYIVVPLDGWQSTFFPSLSDGAHGGWVSLYARMTTRGTRMTVACRTTSPSR